MIVVINDTDSWNSYTPYLDVYFRHFQLFSLMITILIITRNTIFAVVPSPSSSVRDYLDSEMDIVLVQ